MKSFTKLGYKVRIDKNRNYNAVWYDLKTARLGTGVADELPADKSEFYDVSLGTKCNGKCKFCYTSAKVNGISYKNPSDAWKNYMKKFTDKHGYEPNDEKLAILLAGSLFKTLEPDEFMVMNAKHILESGKIPVTYTEKPFQIAIGSEGEPTEHPEFCKFLETVYNTGVIPNYTTNGVILSLAGADPTKGESISDLHYDYSELELHNMLHYAYKLLEYTSKYVGGVAVSYSNPDLKPYAERAINALIKYGNTNVNMHHIISDNNSVDELLNVINKYGDNIQYHVLLPLMKSGRSKEEMHLETFKYLEETINKYDIRNVAFGANFSPYLNNSSIKTYNYPPESLSKNMILRNEHKIILTPSSFDMKPCMELAV